ncbi:MAG: hypothetical protein V3U75_09820 [Methylococcaceae bacterium]
MGRQGGIRGSDFESQHRRPENSAHVDYGENESGKSRGNPRKRPFLDGDYDVRTPPT